MDKFVILFALLVVCFRSGWGIAVTAPESSTLIGDDSPGAVSESDKKLIAELQGQIAILQHSVAEITRSFSTLELVVKNPSMMTKLEGSDEDGRGGQPRVRRDLDTPLPTSLPQNGQHLLAPYSWPMFSGQCFLCPAGVPGPRGPPGSAGVAGRDGRDGRDAPINEKASKDETPANSESQPAQTQSSPVRAVNSTSGAVYVRWGSSECPELAELVYTGTAGGAHHSHAGSGANYLCLPNEPIYDEINAANDVDRALLYSSEYQTIASYNVPERLRPVHDHTPTCAVCRAPPGRTSKLMIPARNVCPSDEWRLEYKGYLMAERYTHKRSEFICMDREIGAQAATQGNQDGALFYMTEARCLVGGGLPCGPYVDGYELTCAVCTI